TGMLLGTPAYMAPEQFLGQETDARSDQFSFCVALYEALFGRRPFAGDSLITLADAVVHGRMEEPAIDSGVPRALVACVSRGLAVDPGRRYPSMDALLDVLASQVSLPASRWRAPPWALALLAFASAAALIAPRRSRAPEGEPASSPAPALPASTESKMNGEET